ncbi:glycoside hydrolase family 79 protein [Tulasnella calospora MUT 4182]|uniref:Glycoside hydrolase family 79 protein n=1 Tax=Tulasnella calospora MUT 4182 TaxID=1051891 RepID=A0A0C3Q177_9AGAM|nr:glycoside hydrolase family 79 protein [Tulasnella calospora MUT 4182]
MKINDLPNEILFKIFDSGTAAARDWDSTGGIYEAYRDQQEARIKQIELDNSEDDDSSSRPSLGEDSSAGAPEGSPNHSTDFQVLCSHVCTRWRAICLGSPLLWNKIYIRYPEDPSFIKHNKSLRYQKTRTWLTRSGDTTPLDIKLNFKHERPVKSGDSVRWLTPFDVDHVVPVIVPYIHRWRSFNMTAKTLKMMRVLLKAIQFESAPLLEHLLLQAPTLGNNTSLDPYPILKGGAPILRHLALAGLAIIWNSLDFPELRELGIFRTVSTEERRLSRNDIVEVLNRSTKLESLVIEGAFISVATNPPVPPATISSLRHLVLETGIPEGPPVDASVLSWIYAPDLLSMHALGWERSSNSWNSILRMLSEGYSGLTCLSLLIEQHPSPDDVPYVDVFRNLQALEDLTLHCAYDTSTLEKDDARGIYCISPLMNAEVCPRLVRLVAMNTGTIIGDWIDLAARRDAARRRLQRLVTNTRKTPRISEEYVETLRLYVDKLVFLTPD